MHHHPVNGKIEIGGEKHYTWLTVTSNQYLDRGHATYSQIQKQDWDIYAVCDWALVHDLNDALYQSR